MIKKISERNCEKIRLKNKTKKDMILFPRVPSTILRIVMRKLHYFPSQLATRRWQLTTRNCNTQLVTRNSQLATRNSQLATPQLAFFPHPIKSVLQNVFQFDLKLK